MTHPSRPLLDVLNREGQAVRSLPLRLGREAGEKTRRDDVTPEGLEPCLALLGL